MPPNASAVPGAGSFWLGRTESVADGLARIARGRADSALEKLGGADDESLAEAIHGARKDLKKLRAVLRLSREALGDELYREENRRFRDAARLLSASRDAEVRLSTLEGLRRRPGSDPPRAAAAVWEEALERERDELAGGRPDVPLAEAVATIAAGRERIDAWPLEGSGWPLLGGGLERAYRDGRRAWRATRDDPGPGSSHEWRKRAKDLWYQLRIVAPAWPPVLEATAAEAHELTDRLGDRNDLALLAEDLGRRAWISEHDRTDLLEAVERAQDELLAEALEIGARLYAEKPRAYRRRLRVYWRAWRD
ncbi:MAG: CHAD domain-containing protein [Solirubrobacterales bacterium]